MKFLKAYLNYDAISSYDNVEGQVEIYEYDTELGEDTGLVEWESYPTEKDMQDRVDFINSHKFTWETLR